MFRKSLPARRHDRREVTLAVVREYQSEVSALRERPYPRAAGITVDVLFASLFIGAIFMYVTRVDRVVTSASGALATADPPVVFQALDPSVIRSLNVREGQRVGKGQILATLDPTFASAQVAQLRSQIEISQAQIARDQALISMSPLQYAPSSNEKVAKYQRESLEYYGQQLAQYNASVNGFDQQIATLRTTVEKFKVDEARYLAEAEANVEIEKMRVTLERHGTGSMLNLLTATQSKIETQRLADFSRNSRIEAEHTLASTQANKQTFIEQFKATVSQDLLTARTTLETSLPQLDAALKHQDLVRWTAPEDSVVLSVAPGMSVGSVLTQGATVITLMPVRERLDALVQITSDQIGFVKPGDYAGVKIDTLPEFEFGRFDGTVEWVGGNSQTQLNGQTVAPYYDVRISIDRNKLVNVPANLALLPGMTLTADINVGRRSIWDYFIGSMAHGLGNSLREP